LGKLRGTLTVWTGLALVALLALSGLHGCDWFGDPIEANFPPETEIDCPYAYEPIDEGGDVVMEWSGNDYDGYVTGFVWSFDDSVAGETQETSVLVKNVSAGTHVFEVSAVDNDDDVDPTPATCSFHVADAGALVERVVLAELITTKWCSACPKAEEALGSMIDEYGADGFCVVGYHDARYAADSLATPETVERIEWYTSDPNFPGESGAFPTVVFDGGRVVEGAGTVGQAEDDYRFEIDLRRDKGSPLTVAVDGDIGEEEGIVTIKVNVRDGLPGTSNVLRAVVIEDEVFSWGEHFNFVTRDILEEEALSVTAVGDSAVIERTFAVEPRWDPDHMDVVVFVQDDATKEVLQSSRLGNQQ
jgi:hypothetical protein